ncbi:MAG: 3-deoxy-D-manno-octulosonic acid transferase [Phycisphaerae bacterium]|nr:3-deoxy-D-manno-octulosonic acid transferase [Phycisphaerae bacterium]
MEARRPGILISAAMDICYGLLALTAWPVYVPLILSKRKWREGLAERLGVVPRLKKHPFRLWVHAISVGEVEAARSFIPALAKACPDAEIVISTTTRTGRERARKLFPQHLVFHFPLDITPSVLSALSRIKPAAVIQVEAEWWPNFMIKATRRGVPIIAVNVRITEKGLRGYQRISSLMRVMLNTPTAIGVQNQLYADRLVSLGADAGRIRITGQMKYDNVSFDIPEGVDELRARCSLEAGEPLLLAASTGPGEPELLLRAYRRLKAKHSRLRLAIVPRRPEQFDETAERIKRAGFALFRLSQVGQGKPVAHDAVILGDTMGELMKFYALADAAFIGRSLVPMGGSNPIEPASLGKAVVFGPHMFNFADPADIFVTEGAARQVKDETEFADTIDELLADPDILRQMGERGQRAITQQQGATKKNIELVKSALDNP